jgi:hypothetical protein
MPRVKHTGPFSFGFLPSALTPTELTDMCKGKVKAELILIFFKYFINRSCAHYEKKEGARKKVLVGWGAPDKTATLEIHTDHLEKIFGKNKSADYKRFMLANGLLEVASNYAPNMKGDMEAKGSHSHAVADG